MLWSTVFKEPPHAGLADTARKPWAVVPGSLQPSAELKRAFPLERSGLRAEPSLRDRFPFALQLLPQATPPTCFPVPALSRQTLA